MNIEDVRVGDKVKDPFGRVGMVSYVRDDGIVLYKVVKKIKYCYMPAGDLTKISDVIPEPDKNGTDVVNLCNSCKHSRWNCVPNETAWDEKYNITSCSQYVLSEKEQQQQKIKELQEEIKNLQYEINRLNVAKVRLKEANEAWQNEIKQLTVEKARYKALWYETNDTLKKCPIIYTKIKEDKNGHQVIACYTSAVELRESEVNKNETASAD